MASSISITVGPTTATRNYGVANAKARDTLLAFYTAQGLGPENATDSDKLLAIIDWLSATIRNRAVRQYVDNTQATATTTAEATYGLE